MDNDCRIAILEGGFDLLNAKANTALVESQTGSAIAKVLLKVLRDGNLIPHLQLAQELETVSDLIEAHSQAEQIGGRQNAKAATTTLRALADSLRSGATLPPPHQRPAND